MPEIHIVPSPDLTRMVRATADLYKDAGYSGKGGISGFGRYVRRGQLVSIDDPFVRANREHFEIAPRPLTDADFE
jgi:hypothetical protein